MGDQYNIQSIQRALALLNCFSTEEPRLGLLELSKKLGLHKSTVYRLIRTLEHENYLQKCNDSEQYTLSSKFLELSRIVLDSLDLRKVSLPVMQELSDSIGYLVFLSQKSNEQKVCIEKIGVRRGLQPTIRIGQILPLHIGSSGKVLMAYTPGKEVNKYLERERAFDTQEKRDKYKAQLAEIRAQGYATGFNERVQDGGAISAPIFDFKGHIAAALTVAGLETNIRTDFDKLLPAVLTAAQKISYQLGSR